VSKFKNVYQGIFSIKNNNDRKVITFLGIKLKLKNKKYYAETKEAIKIQDDYNLLKLINAEKIILFFIPYKFKMCGGIMSIFSLCEYSRHINNDSFCLIATYPGKLTYAKNEEFNNSEQIYRWEQIVKNAKNVKELMIHIPEYYAKDFYSDLSKDEIKFLKSIESLHINIMNQNIELMPKPENLKELYKLTSNITQTIAHDRYATQEICNKWQMPTHLFSVHIDCSKYKSYEFDKKEKIIVLSPDENENKSTIVDKLKRELPDFKLITVESMRFGDYMDLIARAYFTITFGEGMDGYFSQPCYVNSLGFAVYNDKFFPDSSWMELKNVYSSYEEMVFNIISDMECLSKNEIDYTNAIIKTKEKHSKLYQLDQFENNLKKFYEYNYDFYPQKKV